MADLRISQLPPLTAGALASDDVLPVTDVSASETKKVTASDLVKYGIGVLPDGSISIDKIDIPTGTLDGGDLVKNSVTGGVNGALALATITADNIADAAIVDAAISDVSGAKLTEASVSDAKLASGIDGAKLTDGTVSAAKLSGTFDGTNLADGSVTDAKLADGINGAKLTDASVPSAALVEVEGSKLTSGSVTDDKISGLNGSKLVTASVPSSALAGVDGALLSAGSVANEALASGIDGGKLSDSSVGDTQLAQISGTKITEGTFPANRLDANTLNRSIGLDANGNLGISNAIVAGTVSGISFNSVGLIVGASALVGTDLPPATTTTLGGVSVPEDGNLTVTAQGAISIKTVITAATISGITVNQYGQVVNLTALEGSDLPIASSTEIGAISIPSDGKFDVSTGGALTHKTTVAGNGTFTKVTLDASGHVATGASLEKTDIPNLDADQITGGTLPPSVIGDNSLTPQKFGDYSTCLMQEEFPGYSPDYYLGMFWWQPSTAQLRVYARGSAGSQWAAVGFGALQANNLRWGGTFSAALGTITIVTEFGNNAGLGPGSLIPVPTDALSGLYFICQEAGSGVNQPAVAGVEFSNGDWLLCINEADGYTRVDMAGGGGGGGGATSLNELIDVDIAGAGGLPVNDLQMLQYNLDSGMWKNNELIEGGTF